MRDKKWFARADWILWTFIAILPLLAYLVFLSNGDVSHSANTFSSFMTGYGIAVPNFIYTTLTRIFGNSGVFPMFSGNSSNIGIVYFSTYFVSIHLIHLFVDFVLFIPRLAHKFMDGFLGGD